MSPQPLPMSRILRPGLQIELGGDQAQLVAAAPAPGSRCRRGSRRRSTACPRRGTACRSRCRDRSGARRSSAPCRSGLACWKRFKPQRHLAQHLLHRVRAERQPVDGEQRQEIAQRRVLEAEAAVHVGFAGMQLGIEEQLAVERAVGEPHRDVRAAGRAREDVRLPVRIDHLQGADAHERLQHMRQWKHRSALHGLPHLPQQALRIKRFVHALAPPSWMRLIIVEKWNIVFGDQSRG